MSTCGTLHSRAAYAAQSKVAARVAAAAAVKGPAGRGMSAAAGERV
ncbi:MAG: hypothetical protein M0D55_05725 [Elusimicrobiota bacterium]|nr:MAG: hypothetical protein M0D55_05725 [Elusimicrobiota bacterium]